MNKLLFYCLLLLGLTLLVIEYFFEYHLEVSFANHGFFAWYGFLSCVLFMAVALGLGKLVKRREDYYDEDKSDDKH